MNEGQHATPDMFYQKNGKIKDTQILSEDEMIEEIEQYAHVEKEGHNNDILSD